MTAVWLLCHFAVLYGVFSGPALILMRRLRLSLSTCAMLAVLVFSLVGYVNFWFWLWSPAAGRTFVVIASAAALLALVAQLRANGLRELKADVIVPYALIAAFGVLYVGLVSLDTNHPIGLLPETKFGLTGDGQIPKGFADHLEAGTDPRAGVGDWLSSDRPPLQSGIVLLQQDFLGVAYRDDGYELLGMLCQLAWIAGLWALCRAAGLEKRQAILVTMLIGMTSFTFLNSVFLWPKMLAASFALYIVSLVIGAYREKRALTRVETILSAAAFALAMLSHGGVAFTLGPLIVWITFGRQRPALRNVVTACAVCVLLLFPWFTYQHVYDPPGDRLIKWHVAGVIPVTDHRPAFKTIVDEYRRAGSLQIVTNKWANFSMLAPRFILTPADWIPRTVSAAEQAFNDQGFFFFDSCGLLLIGALPLALLLIRGGRLEENRALAPLVWLLVASLAFWVIVMFGPATTISHQGSYANNLIAGFVLCSGLILTIEWAAWVILAVECVQLYLIVQAYDLPSRATNVADVFELLLGFILLAVIVACNLHRGPRAETGLNPLFRGPAIETLVTTSRSKPE